MKKLLGLLALAPMALTACTTSNTDNKDGNTQGDGNGGSETTTPITALNIFGNENVSVETVNNWFTNGHADNLKTGVFGQTGTSLSYNMQKGTTDLYSFTNIDGQSVTNKSATEGFGEFKTALSAIDSHNDGTNASAVPANYNTLVKSGQVINGSALPGNTETIANADFASKPVGAPSNTILSSFDLRPFASLIDTHFGKTAFGNNVDIKFTPGAPLMGGAVQTPILISNTSALANVQGIDAGPTPFNGQLATQFYQPAMTGNDRGNTFTLDPMGSITLCHNLACSLVPRDAIKSPNNQPFVSWYVERYRDNPFSNYPATGSDALNTWGLRLAQFDADGNKQFEIGKFDVGYPITGFDATTGPAAFGAALDAITATTTIDPSSGGFQVTTQGSPDGVDANHKKGIAIKSTATDWFFKADNLTGKFNFTDAELRPAFDHWTQNTLLPGLTSSTGVSFEIKMNGTDYEAYSDLDILYKDACLKAKEMIEAGNAVFTNTCPA